MLRVMKTVWEFVREIGCFPERKGDFLMFRSGKGVVS